MLKLHGIIGSDQPECEAFLIAADRITHYRVANTTYRTKSPAPGQVKAKAPPLVGPCWHLSGYGAFCYG
jgi:hypothetical protein